MERRALLSTVVAGIATGCVGGQSGNPGEEPTSTPGAADGYETCDRILVSTNELPADVRAEFDEALETGSYDAETVYLDTAIDTERSYLRHDGDYYEATVAAMDGGEHLTLQGVETPTLPEERRVSVENRGESLRTLHVTVDGGDLLDVTVELAEDQRERFSVTDEFGTYDLRAEVDGVTETFRWRVSGTAFDAVVSYGDDGLVLTQAVADVAPCPWRRS